MHAHPIDVTVFNDPACPWGYSAIPALRTLQWRYHDQLRWRLVLIGLAEDAQLYLDRGYSTLRTARGWAGFRRFGMPFAPEPKARVAATSPACRAIVAARLQSPGLEWAALRALQVAQFTSPMVLDDRAALERALARVAGLDAAAAVAAIDTQEVVEDYQRDRAESRTAAGSPGSLQGKTANSDGQERFTAPSVLFERGGQRFDATGFQPIEAYDVLLANLDPSLERRAPAGAVGEALAAFPEGLVTQEVAAIRAVGNEAPDRAAAEHDLLELADGGGARRVQLGDDALWLPTPTP